MSRLGDVILFATIISIVAFLFGPSWGLTAIFFSILYIIIQIIKMNK